jgi:(p)ppGpp synthase/HD superfamily hydrolase
MPEEKRRQKANEAIRAYGRLAGILNCYRWRRWLEDMAFPHADPDTYNYVRDRVDHDPRLKTEFIRPMMAKLGEIMEKAGIEGRVEITVNGYWQAWQKMRRLARSRKSSMETFSALNDLISFRLIVESNLERDCYLLLGDVNRFLGSYIDQNRFDDYIACPQNGYKALQVTAWYPDCGAFEVAITTDQMEGENLWGIIYRIKNNLDINQYRAIEILTPTGGARFLPENSTVLDAVASIQQEFLLDKISSVEVNGKMARLSDKVQAGDIVEVITSGHRLKPSQEWLNFCNDSTARVLRMVLDTQSLIVAAETGHKIIKEVLNQRGILELKDVDALHKDKIDNLLARLACASIEDIYVAIGSGAIRLIDFEKSLDDAGICQDMLGWSSILLVADKRYNRPGVLSQLAGIVSESGGNILRSVNNTLPNGGFLLRIVIGSLDLKQKSSLKDTLLHSGIVFSQMELV